MAHRFDIQEKEPSKRSTNSGNDRLWTMHTTIYRCAHFITTGKQLNRCSISTSSATSVTAIHTTLRIPKIWKWEAYEARLLNTFAINNLINESHKLKHRILFEKIPRGQEYLTTIIEAMRDNFSLMITYKAFWQDNPATFEIRPYFIRVFKQR